MGELVAGGVSGDITTFWKAPWGWDGTQRTGAIWLGQKPATADDLRDLHDLGWEADPLSLVGTHDRAWSAYQYSDQDHDDLLNPWDVLPRPGGEGSLTYQLQKVPDGIDCFAKPRWWIHSKGKAFRAEGGEPCHRVKMGDGHSDLYLGGRPGSPAEDLEFKWNTDDKLWEVDA